MASQQKKSTIRKRSAQKAPAKEKKRDDQEQEKAPESEAPPKKESKAPTSRKKKEVTKAATVECILPTEEGGKPMTTDEKPRAGDDKKAGKGEGKSKIKKGSKGKSGGSKEKGGDGKGKKKGEDKKAITDGTMDTGKEDRQPRSETGAVNKSVRKKKEAHKDKKGKKTRGRSYMEGIKDVIDEKLLDIEAVSPGSESSHATDRPPLRSRYAEPKMANNHSLDCDIRTLWATSIAKSRIKPLLGEFLSVRKYLPPDLETDHFLKHPTKNRYADVLCTDKTRLVIKNRGPDEDYIHANWVTLPKAEQARYICTQGPTDETVEDFWHMVSQEKCYAVVMLCSLVEEGEDKCAQYWPANEGESLESGPFRIRNKGVAPANLDTVQYTTLEITRGDESHTLSHFQWSGWPDQLAPASPAVITGLIRRITENAGKSPVVVHCSAGIGRTGTFVAVHYAIEELSLNGTVSMVDVIKSIRAQRVHAIQTVTQYLFLHVCVLDFLVSTECIAKSHSLEKFTNDYVKYLQKLIQRRENDKRVEEVSKEP